MADLSEFMDSGFDDRSVAPSSGVPEPVPVGDYLLQVENTDVVLNKAGDGAMLKVELRVVSGEYEGRRIFPQFNIRNKSAQAQQIGIAELKALCLATGVDYETVRQDTDALLYQPFHGKVGMEKQNVNPATGEPYPPRNRVTKYVPRDEAPAAAASSPAAKPAPAAAKPPAPTAVRPAAAAAKGPLPWGNKAKPAAAVAGDDVPF